MDVTHKPQQNFSEQSLDVLTYPPFVNPFLFMARTEGWMEHLGVVKVFAVFIVVSPLTLVPHRSHWTPVPIMEVLHRHQIRSQYLQLLVQGLQWFFIHGGKGLTGSNIS